MFISRIVGAFSKTMAPVGLTAATRRAQASSGDPDSLPMTLIVVRGLPA